MDEINNEQINNASPSETNTSADQQANEPSGKTYEEVNVTDCDSILNGACAKKISAARIARKAAAISAVIAAGAIAAYYVAGDRPEESESGIHPFTQSCIDAKADLKSSGANGITDINCSFEDGRKRVYYTMTNEELAHNLEKIPAKAVTAGCEPFSVEFFIAADASAVSDDIEARLKEAGIEKFCQRDPDGASFYELNYVDAQNTPHQQISVRLPK